MAKLAAAALSLLALATTASASEADDACAAVRAEPEAMWNATVAYATEGEVTLDMTDAELGVGLPELLQAATAASANLTDADLEAMLMMQRSMAPIITENPESIVAILGAMEPLVREGGINASLAAEMGRGIDLVRALDNLGDDFPMQILVDSLTVANQFEVSDDQLVTLYEAVRPLLRRFNDNATRARVAQTISDADFGLSDGFLSFIVGTQQISPLLVNSMLNPVLIQATLAPYMQVSFPEAAALARALQQLVPDMIGTMNALSEEERTSLVELMQVLTAVHLEPDVIDGFLYGVGQYSEQNDAAMFRTTWEEVFVPMMEDLDGSAIEPLVGALPRLFEGDGAAFNELPREQQERALDATLSVLRAATRLGEGSLAGALPALGRTMLALDVAGVRRMQAAVACASNEGA